MLLFLVFYILPMTTKCYDYYDYYDYDYDYDYSGLFLQNVPDISYRNNPLSFLRVSVEKVC